MLTAKLEMVEVVREKLPLLASMFKRNLVQFFERLCGDTYHQGWTALNPKPGEAPLVPAQLRCCRDRRVEERMLALTRFPLTKSQLPSHAAGGCLSVLRHLTLPLYRGKILTTLGFESCFGGHVPEV